MSMPPPTAGTLIAGTTTTTRRTFLKLAGGSTIALLVTPVSALAQSGVATAHLGDGWQGSPGWSGGPGEARFRIEGLPKVLGQKIYARDFRARDIPGWPQAEQVAMLLRATHADRPFADYDLSRLPAALRPRTVVDAATLTADHITDLFADTSPTGRPGGVMAAKGQIPVYLGQPVAILIFDDMATYRAAYRRLQFQPGVITYGEPMKQSPLDTPYSPPTYLTFYQDGEGVVCFSQTLNGYSNPVESPPTTVDLEARTWRAKIDAEIDEHTASGDWRVFSTHTSTQVLDPMFMEPEAGLAWLDGTTLRLVLGTQATNGDVQNGVELFSAAECPIEVDTVDLISCYPGGGFGGRDTSPFPPLLMLTAAYADGPVRIANDRFAQFQSGLKQLGSEVEQRLTVDREGRFQALQAEQRLPSGGKNNYSQYVAELAGYTAGGGYRWPRASVNATAQPTVGVVAGSMRGFGGPQAAFALETLIDEIADDLGLDAIELRLKNALQEKDPTVTGAPYDAARGIAGILQRALRNPLWTERHREAERREGRLYGVGFALANQAYGTGSDGVMAEVSVDADGEIRVQSNCVDTGNGSATALAISTAGYLGRNADAIRLGEVSLFDALELSTTKPAHGRRAAADPWLDPHYTAGFSMSSSACITAFQQVHAVTQASRALFDLGLWPAACRIWGVDSRGPAADASREAAGWSQGRLELAGHEPLPLERIAARAHKDGTVVAAMVHAYYAARWVHAVFQVYDVMFLGPIDGLATRSASASKFAASQFATHLRRRVVPPPPNAKYYGRSLYAPSGSLVAVEIEPDRGDVSIDQVYSYLDAGRTLQPDLLSGQYQGAVAMGTGYALLENLPIGVGGAGEGDWNLNRYQVALARHLPLDRIHLETLPAADDDTAKGIAEAVLCPIAPAIGNAVAAATGHRFRSLPITPAQIREALR